MYPQLNFPPYLGILESETGSEERGFVEKHDQILHIFVVFVRLGFLAKRLHDRVFGVDLKLFGKGRWRLLM